MESDKDHIKKVFGSKLRNLEPDLPDSIWNKIDADLSLNSAINKKPARRLIYRAMLSVGAVASIFVALLYLLPQSQNDSIPFISTQVAEGNEDEMKVEKVSKINNEILVSNNSEHTQTSQRSNKLEFRASHINESVIEDQGDLLSLDENIQNSNPIVSKTIEEALPVKVEDQKFDHDLNNRIAEFKAKGNDLENMLSSADSFEKSSKNKAVQLGLEGGSGFSKSNDTKNQINAMHQGSYGVALRSGKVKLKHNHPISFGFGVSKYITNKISIETGLNYAYVSSKIKNEDDRVVKQKDAQYFHYLGVPLTINYTFTEWKRFRFYTSLGGMIQKDFYGKIRSDLNVDLFNVDEVDEKKISQKNPQFSTSLGIGISYPIYDKLKVYSNFRGSYYFDAKNEYETIYSDKKWLFNFNLGLKFEF